MEEFVTLSLDCTTSEKISMGAPVTLRHSMISDSRFVRRLSKDVFTVYGPYEDIILGWFESGKCVTIIACQDKIPIGFAMVGEPSDRYNLQNVSEVLGIAVEPERQGRGVGKLLLVAIDTTSASRNIKCLFLHTAIDNMPARSLYERVGYRQLEITRNFYPEGQDAIVMYKDLKSMF